jgi:SAM-dependent methyltransferase
MEGPAISLACPHCLEYLAADGDTLDCPGCGQSYPVVAGVPDLRVSPDPWIGLEDDRAKALRVLAASEGMGFADTVRTYWSLTPTTPAPQAERFIDHVVNRAAERTAEWLTMAAEDTAGDTGPWLDLGCGTADLAAVAGPGRSVVCVDVALRWLVIARKRLEEAGVPAVLVCANAEALPFADRAFGRVFGLGVLEHCGDADAALAQSRRVLQPGGVFRTRTVNRYSLLPEPHVGLMGIGFMPRRMAQSYVLRRTGQPYEHHHSLGRGRLAGALRRAGFRDVRVGAAPTLSTETETMSGAARRLVPLYDWARRTPGPKSLVDRVAPLLEARGVAG